MNQEQAARNTGQDAFARAHWQHLHCKAANPVKSTENMSKNDVLRVKLEVLKREHRDLDDAITALQDKSAPDQLTLRRLKKQKLSLKDRIAALEDQLTPDIIA